MSEINLSPIDKFRSLEGLNAPALNAPQKSWGDMFGAGNRSDYMDLYNNTQAKSDFMAGYNITPDSSTSDVAVADAAFAKQQEGAKTDWGMTGLGGTALGVGQLGLGVMSYLENQKTANKQRELMGQQLEQNKFVLDQAKGRQKDIGATFGGK